MSPDDNSQRGALAIDGGRPVRTAPMPWRRAFGDDERRMIDEVFAHYDPLNVDPGYEGDFEKQYCAQFTAALGGGHADAVSTGTAAVFLAIAALELPRGSEVLVASVTDPGCFGAIILNGLVPRLVDTAPGRYNLSWETVRARITSRSAAVLAVHATGQAIDDIETLAREAARGGLRVIEDCSQAHLARVGGRAVGTFGDIAAFSTMYRKTHISGSSGGLVFSRDVALLRRAMAHADRGKERWRPDFDDRNPASYLFPALNFNSNEISCAVGMASLKRLPETIARRLAYARGVRDGLARASRACRGFPCDDGYSPFIYPVAVDATALRVDKTRFAEAVRAEGIPLNPHYKFLAADWPWLRPHLSDDFACPNARAVLDSTFLLYLNERYGPQEIEDTVTAILKVERAYAR